MCSLVSFPAGGALLSFAASNDGSGAYASHRAGSLQSLSHSDRLRAPDTIDDVSAKTIRRTNACIEVAAQCADVRAARTQAGTLLLVRRHGRSGSF